MVARAAPFELDDVAKQLHAVQVRQSLVDRVECDAHGRCIHHPLRAVRHEPHVDVGIGEDGVDITIDHLGRHARGPQWIAARRPSTPDIVCVDRHQRPLGRSLLAARCRSRSGCHCSSHCPCKHRGRRHARRSPSRRRRGCRRVDADWRARLDACPARLPRTATCTLQFAHGLTPRTANARDMRRGLARTDGTGKAQGLGASQ
mmetsp:Transcript_100965/g.324131  ORF Transcript_100965/g.324131 Transcript_100965/m.324131 type:complete len:203 (-) Transcript_100965:38-646(-)